MVNSYESLLDRKTCNSCSQLSITEREQDRLRLIGMESVFSIVATVTPMTIICILVQNAFLVGETNMNCKNIGFGTYDCAYNIMLPWLTTDPCNPNNPPQPYTAAIDKCLLPEILKLWEMGIKTTDCCCGHGKQDLAFIGVLPEYIPRMKELGYQVRFNSCRPGDEDSFVPKTELKYDSADKGFNWWDS